MVGWRGTGRERGGAYAFAPQRPSAVSLLGWVGHRNGDRDCEPAQLTEHQATVRLGVGKITESSSAYRAARTPPPSLDGGVLQYQKGAMMRKGLKYLNIAEKCQNWASQATDPRVKKKLESMARSLKTLAARRAEQLSKPVKAPRARSRWAHRSAPERS